MSERLIPLLVAVVAAVIVAAASRRVRPQTAAWLLSLAIGSVFVAGLASAWVLALGYLAHEPFSREILGWCRDALGVHHRLSAWIGVPAVVTAIAGSARTIRVARRWRVLAADDSETVELVDSPQAIAFARPGHGGAIVVSTGMLEALAPAERAAVLAHERAHVREGHGRFLLLADLVSGLAPLRPLVTQLRHTLERCADEASVVAVGDRRIVATAIAKAALAGQRQPAGALGVMGAGVPARVEALLRQPTDRRTAMLVAGIAAAGVALAAGAAGVQLHHLSGLIGTICLD